MHLCVWDGAESWHPSLPRERKHDKKVCVEDSEFIFRHTKFP